MGGVPRVALSAKKSKEERARLRQLQIEEKVERVEAYLDRIGGSAQLRGLRAALGKAVDIDFLQEHFEVSADGEVQSKQGYNRQESNIKKFLIKRGIVPVALVLQTFRVSRHWLETHKDFFVQDQMVKLRVTPTLQPDVDIVDEHVGHLFTMRPSSDLPADREISRLRIFLMSKVARLPIPDRKNALRRLKGMWHPDLAEPRRYDVISAVFQFLSTVDVTRAGLTIKWRIKKSCAPFLARRLQVAASFRTKPGVWLSTGY